MILSLRVRNQPSKLQKEVQLPADDKTLSGYKEAIKTGNSIE
jgi:hypothetical protein